MLGKRGGMEVPLSDQEQFKVGDLTATPPPPKDVPEVNGKPLKPRGG